MRTDSSRRFLRCSFLAIVLLWPLPGWAQRISSNQQSLSQSSDPELTANLMVTVRDESGGANSLIALVTISRMEGGMFRQASTDNGQVQFEGLRPGLYTIKVSAAGYEDSVQTVDVDAGIIIAQAQLRPNGEAAAAAQHPPGLPVLSPKAQKLAAEVWKSLQENKLDNAHAALEKLYQLAPANPDVNYMYGLYEVRVNDQAQAHSYWQKAIEIYPKHVGALLQLSQAALQQNKPGEAMPLLNTALEAAPSSWRAHAMMAQALLEQKQFPQAEKEAGRAIDLGHTEADAVQPLLARALAAEGEKDRAVQVLQTYLKAHPENTGVQKMLDALKPPAAPPPSAAPPQPSSPTPDASSRLMRGNPEIHVARDLALGPPGGTPQHAAAAMAEPG